MNLDDHRHMFEYSLWASRKLLDACAELTDEQWTRDLGNSFPSVRDTFAHLIAAEWLWLKRWKGHSPGRPDWVDTASVARLREILDEVHAERSAFLDGLTDAGTEDVVSFTFLSGKAGAQRLGGIMSHVNNHSTYHRGQVVTMLRQLGVAPPSTDLYAYNDITAPAAAS
ncbi:MAG TPA: DinB family protein [Longimicrobiaceae bacterium]|nr:DinB family protein [Longimicrobiaceae bacterium]